MQRSKRSALAAALSLLLAGAGCTASKNYQKDVDDATSKGKYRVRLTTDPEVVGTCKFVKAIDPNQDPVGGVPKSDYPDYFRVHAVLMGADTVLVREGKFGEAYICGPAPLNPDGTLKTSFDAPAQHP